jgi:hypothetical protein
MLRFLNDVTRTLESMPPPLPSQNAAAIFVVNRMMLGNKQEAKAFAGKHDRWFTWSLCCNLIFHYFKMNRH